MAYFLLKKSKLHEQCDIAESIADNVVYNYKTNPISAKIIEKERKNIFLSISSKKSYKAIKDKKRIHYLVQAEKKSFIKKINKEGVNNFIVDNINDFNKVKDLNANIFIRVKLKEHSIYTSKYFVYGFDIEEAKEIIKKYSNKLKLALHLHRKTQNIGEWNLREELLNTFKKSELKKLFAINIGGGLPVDYANSKANIKEIIKRIKDLKKEINKLSLKLYIEPGRFITAPAVNLHTKVINKYKNNLILDCSIYNAYMDSFLFNIRLKVKDEGKGSNRYILKGCSPDSLDIFRYNVLLPEKKINDEIVFLNAGAYNFYTEFNDMPKIKTKII